MDNFNSADVRKIVNRSLERLGIDTVDIVQFHWWKYEANHYLDAMEELFNLKRLEKSSILELQILTLKGSVRWSMQT